IKDPSDSMVGVLRFKKGFCGNEVIYCGEFDYNFNPIANSAIKLVKKYYQIATRLKNKLKK
ncbi:MAG: peptidoglycan bridge formation glycyltransferase FemA/FemB family protein, partial [Clostridia bacterium]